MLIVCPSCASEYTLDPERIGAGGRTVRCAVCRTTWFVQRPAAEGADALPAVLSSDSIEASTAPTLEAAQLGELRGPPPPRPIRPPRSIGKPNGTREVLAMVAIVLALALIPSVLTFREKVVRHVPASAQLFASVGLGVNILGLELSNLTAALGEEGSARALTIEGEIRSVALHAVGLPRLEFTIESAERQSLYRWSVKPPVGELGPGETARFTTRLAAPPPDGTRLVATFVQDGGDQSVAMR